MAETLMGNVLVFPNKLGVYDVILPFLLVFTIVYAILDKTRVLGVEEAGKEKFPKRNLNAMVAFVMGFLVVASGQLVATINEAMANIVVLLLVGVCYLMLLGTFYKTGEISLDGDANKTQLYVFMFINFVGVILIFLHAIPTGDGSNWLAEILDFLASNWERDYVGAIVLLIFVVFFMHWIIGPAPKTSEGGKEK